MGIVIAAAIVILSGCDTDGVSEFDSHPGPVPESFGEQGVSEGNGLVHYESNHRIASQDELPEGYLQQYEPRPGNPLDQQK
jgi:hypothetical protein